MPSVKPTLSFTVELEGYGYLTIENITVSGIGPGNPSISPLQPPPLNQSVLGNAPSATAPSPNASDLAASTMSRGWGLGWCMSVYRALHQITAGGAAPTNILFECPSLDDSDINWGVTASADATTDPLKLIVNPFGTSRTGRKFAVGDYVIWNDPQGITDPVSGSTFTNYEIDQIIALKGNAWTLKRAGPGAAGGKFAQFGTIKQSHGGIGGSPLVIYRLIDKLFTVPFSGAPQPVKLLWDNMTVAVVVGTVAGADPVTVSLLPLAGGIGKNPIYTPTHPGLRTLTGNEYVIPMSAPLTVGAIADFWLPVTGPESIRSAFGKLSLAAVGGISQIWVIYRTPDLATAGLIDILNFPAGAVTSYDLTSNRPEMRRQMPYHDGWPPVSGIGFDYPPNILPACPTALLPNGDLDPAFGAAATVNVNTPILFEEGGSISYVCTHAPTGGGTSPGQVDVVTVQT